MAENLTQRPDDPFIVLFKLGERRYMERLLHEGELYLNTLDYFRRLEDGTPRSDRDEAVGYNWQMDGGTFEMQDEREWRLVGTLVGGIRVEDPALLDANVYSLHARRASQCTEPWKLDYLDFGDTFVLFFNPSEFLERVRRAAQEEGHRLSWGPVEYVDRRKYHGPMGAFRKFEERAVDLEFRILLQPGAGGPLRLQVGDLTDIAFLGETSKRLKLIPKEEPS